MIEPANRPRGALTALNIDNALLTIPDQLLVGPNWIDHIGLAWNADVNTSTESFPVATVNFQYIN